jgi:hypothetical protein
MRNLLLKQNKASNYDHQIDYFIGFLFYLQELATYILTNTDYKQVLILHKECGY